MQLVTDQTGYSDRLSCMGPTLDARGIFNFVSVQGAYKMQQKFSFEPRFAENFAKKTQHIRICEYFFAKVSAKIGQRWTFLLYALNAYEKLGWHGAIKAATVPPYIRT